VATAPEVRAGGAGATPHPGVARLVVLAALCAVGAVGCDADRPESGAPDASADGARARDGASPAVTRDAGFVDTPPCTPTLASVQSAIFATTCTAEYCHGGTPAGGLWLLSPDVARELVGAPAMMCGGWTLVTPGSPERSLLWQKLTSDHPPCRTEHMPFGKGRLRPEALACVRGWIESLGADGGSAPPSPHDASAPDAARRDTGALDGG
jgi:hypothetical protein